MAKPQDQIPQPIQDYLLTLERFSQILLNLEQEDISLEDLALMLKEADVKTVEERVGSK